MKYTCIAVFLIVTTCTTISAQDKSITLGSGGGFSGAATVYKITSAGEVFKGKGITEIKFSDHGKLKKRKAVKFIKSVSKKVSELNFEHPGNMYYFLAADDHKITWGDLSRPVPENVSNLYQEIMKTIIKIHFQSVP